MANNPMFTRPQLDIIREELQAQVNATTLELVLTSLAARTVELPAIADETARKISYTKDTSGTVTTMIPDIQIAKLFSPVSAATTGELLAKVSNHPTFKGKVLTLEEVK